MAGKWAGDEDLGDRTLEELFAEYRNRCTFVKDLDVKDMDKIQDDCETLLSSLHKDSEFLTGGEKEARIAYEKALEKKKLSENSMMELSWAHIGFVELQKTLKKIEETLSFITTCIILGDDKTVKKILTDFKKELCIFLKGVYSKRRTAASHLMAFMISDERRNSKPYAIPVKFLPYQSISDGKLRELEGELENEMKAIDMVTVGM